MEEFKMVSLKSDEVQIFIDECIAVIKISMNVFEGLADLVKSEELMNWYNMIEENVNIKAVLIINEPGSFSENAYLKFLSKLSGKDVKIQNINAMDKDERKYMHIRETHLLQRFILKKLNSSKVFISCLQGSVVTPFFGASLASECRFASEDMSFSLAHIKYGYHPGGGLPFFLPRYLKQKKALDILLRGGEISAKEALELGLINGIFPKDDFENSCIAEAKKYCNLNTYALKLTKKLSVYFKDELERYFNLESAYVE